ncbi:hypothetical protein MSAN_02208300 [Mycena sanguinolenta]|uniref:NACHT domain-containing protein n=1 Tax=Mycena sanguinolenta TaxID=230812 RepID=A0A8H6XCL0_9AGAR|nr:hypothetical protein MSAN_02208300 [Mycena sanguinolenta]
MAEMAGLVASILQLVDTVAKAREYIHDFRNARKDQKKLLLEIKNLDPLLTQLHQRILSAQTAGAIRAVQKFIKPLEQLKGTMDQLAKKLNPVGTSGKIANRLTWSLWGKDDVHEALNTVERFKTLLGVWLSMDICFTSVGIASAMQDVAGKLHDTAHAVEALDRKQFVYHCDIISTVMHTAEEQRIGHTNVSKSLATIARSQDAADRDTIIGWYSPLNFFLRQADVFSTYQPGTGQWFLMNSTFQEWKAGKGKVLWCRGMPGAGKTVLLSAVIDHLRTDPQGDNVGVAAIYLSHKESDAHTPSTLLAGLWRQLVLRKSIAHVQSLYQAHCEPCTRPSLEEDLIVLRSVVSEYSKVFILVDALDEYPDPQRSLLLRHLAALGPSVNLMLASRPHTTIDHRISKFTTVEIRATAEDIRIYLSERIQNSPLISKHLKNSPHLRNLIESKVVQHSDGMFLLAKLHIDSLMEKLTIRSVREALESIPDDLESTYDEVVERINRQTKEYRKVAWLTLSWITNAKRPLRPSELREALAVEPGDKALDPENLVDDDTVISACAGLVVINGNDDTIRLVHYTLQNYLERIQSRQFPDAPLQITTVCLTYLSFDKPTHQSWHSQTDPAFWNYSAAYWMVHTRGEAESRIKPLILSFLARPTQWLTQEIPSSAEGFPTSPLWISTAFNLDEICGHLIDVVSKELCTDLDSVIGRLIRLVRDPESSLELPKTDAQVVLDLVQTLLDHDAFLPVRSALFPLLLELSRVHKLYPTCFVLTGLQEVEEYPAEYGSTNDVYHAILCGTSVSVKLWKPRYSPNIEKPPLPEPFGHEALIWRQLAHPNVLPFFGLSYYNKRLSLVSPWMENERALPISGSLHSVKQDSLTRAQNHMPAVYDTNPPELFTGESQISLASDVYAFAYICQKVLTWEPPFVEMRTDAAIIMAILNGVRPTQPASSLGIPVLDNLWSLMYDCWKADPRERPVIGEIIERLRSPLIGATTSNPTAEWNQELTCKFRRSLQAQPLLPAADYIIFELINALELVDLWTPGPVRRSGEK